MREISEKLRNAIISAIPTSNLVLCYAPLYGTSPTIKDRVLAANDGTFTNPKWKTLPNGLVVPNFDGTAYIKNSTANWRSGDSGGAIIVFFRPSAGGGSLFSSSDEATISYYFTIRCTTICYIIARKVGVDNIVAGSTILAQGKWASLAATSNGSTYTMLLNGAPETLTGTNNGDWFADIINRDNFTVGDLYRTSSVIPFSGQIGLVLVYSVAPTTAQILRMTNRLRGVFH